MRRTPRPLADSIRALRAEVQPETLLGSVQAHWADAVGRRIASEAAPVRERGGTVTVECRAATWAQELDLLQDQLLGKLNDELGDAQVERLRFVVGDGAPLDTD